ncbi:MAG: metallophosphoesterase, partial [Desulfobacterales bacterium]|nr:metallophosphoesterase [Desulfobacterales bacterium]
MKLAFISDIHGNQDALKSVLEHISANNVDKVVCLGDVVGYGPEAKECIDLLIENGITSVIGNHEEYIM